MARYVKIRIPALLVSLLFFALQVHSGQYDYEYKDGPQQPVNPGESPEHNFVSVNSKGQVMPFHWNPAERDVEREKPIEVIPKKKVVGGKTSNPGAVPYIINIELNGGAFCGGSIYNSKTIITAAHCFHNRRGMLPKNVLDSLNYVAGEFDMDVTEGNEQKRKAINVLIHPDYDHTDSYNDIAIVTVNDPYVYTKYVQPIPVDRPPVVPEVVRKAQVSGWGYTMKRESGTGTPAKHFPNKLQEANIRVFTVEECYGFYGRFANMKPLIDAGLICAGHERGTQDACQGDSGGPLACYNPKKGNRRYLCGVVATGIGCGLPNLPGLYTRVAQFHEWIIENAGYADRRTIDDVRDKI